MTSAAQAAAVVAAVVNLLVAAWGGWRWYQADDASPMMWRAIRVAQLVIVLHVATAGVLYLEGLRPADDLYVLYVGLPVAVSFVAEQLRVLSAQSVLEARNLDGAAAVGALDEAGQRSVLTAILRRELGIMAAACGVAAFLLLRAYGTV